MLSIVIMQVVNPCFNCKYAVRDFRHSNVTVYFKNDTTKKVIISGRGNYGLKPDEIKVKDAIGDIFLNSDDTVTKYNLVIETHKEAGYK